MSKKLPTFSKKGVRADVALFLFGGVMLGLLAVTLLGCATTAYATCEERAAQHGTVLECKPIMEYRDGHRVTRCLVSTPEGDKFHYYKSCGPDSVRPTETYPQ